MTNKQRILIVDDEQIVRDSLCDYLQNEGFEVVTVVSGQQAFEELTSCNFDVMLLDMKMPGMDGIDVLRRTVVTCPGMPVVMITAYATIQSAVDAIKIGAYDYITKPIDPEHLVVIIKKIAEYQKVKQENIELKRHFQEHFFRGEIIGSSPCMLDIFELIKQVAPTDAPVLICGESGTGKELIAQAIHANSQRRYKAFIVASCGAMAETLVESELFGHEKGAFTGATYQKRGRFELADHGTLFLDEVGEMSMKTQVDLLRVIQEKKFYRVGGTTPLSTDARIVSATNRDLEAAIDEKLFREDLFYRLNVINIYVPPLRERKEDIPPLAQHFINKFSIEMNKKIKTIENNTMKMLIQYHWPGNVRELQNAIERAVVVSKEGIISNCDLPQLKHLDKELGPTKNLRDVEKYHISCVLNENDWNISKSARELGIDRITLYKKIEKYHLRQIE